MLVPCDLIENTLIVTFSQSDTSLWRAMKAFLLSLTLLACAAQSVAESRIFSMAPADPAAGRPAIGLSSEQCQAPNARHFQRAFMTLYGRGNNPYAVEACWRKMTVCQECKTGPEVKIYVCRLQAPGQHDDERFMPMYDNCVFVRQPLFRSVKLP